MFKVCFRNAVSKKVAEPIPVINENKLMMPFPEDCTHCGKCAENCPAKAIKIDKEWTIDLGKCIFCLECTEVCDGRMTKIDAPDYALSREDMIVKESERPSLVCKVLPKEKVKRFGRSIGIRELDTGSCNACETEINCCSNPYYDMGRFGLKIVASPRHADVLLVTGPMTNNMKDAAKRTYDAAANPKIVIAAGTCAISGGIFAEGDVVPGSVDSVLDADVYIIGCPPSPDRIIRSIMKSFGFIQQQ